VGRTGRELPAREATGIAADRSRPTRRRTGRRPLWLPGLLAVIALLSGCTATGAASSALGSLASSGQVTVSSSVIAAPATASAPATTGTASGTPSTTPPPPPPPPPLAAVSATPADGAVGVDPLAPFGVAVTGGTLESVRLVNAAGEEIPLAGTLAADLRSWTAATELGYGKTYTISSSARNIAGELTPSTSSFTTVLPNNKTAASSFPTDGMTVGVAQPIAVVFDEPITDRAAAERAITVTTAPAQVGGFRWITEREVRWRPQSFWPAGTTVAVTVDIYGKDLGDGVYGQQDLAFGFTIGRAMVAEIDDNTKTMTVWQDGQQINSIPVSLGSNKYPTYNGVHVVAEKYQSKIMDSSTWGLTGVGAYRTEVGWATRISSSGEFVHAAPWSLDAQGVENVSHGCVNVSTDAAIWFYDTFIPGDPVTIKNTVGPPLEVWDGYGDFQLSFEDYIGA